MEKPYNPTRAYVHELLWAALMINVIMGLVGLLVGAHLESIRLGLGLFLGGGLVITAVLALVVAVNAGVAKWLEWRRSQPGFPPTRAR